MPTPPKLLVELQDWFTDGLQQSNHQSSLKSNDEISHYITASTQQNSQERYNIYVKDYWPRCIQSLKEDFPCLTHLWDDKTIKKNLTSYLKAYPSKSFTLFHLGQNMKKYFNETYKEKDKEKIIYSINYNWAQMVASFSKKSLPLTPQKLNAEKLPNTPLHPQDHVTLLKLPFTYTTWEKNNYNKKDLKKETNYVCVLQKNNRPVTLEIEKNTYIIIQSIIKNKTIQKAIDKITTPIEPITVQESLTFAVKHEIFCHPHE